MAFVDDAALPPDVCRRWLPSLERNAAVDAPALVCVAYAGGNATAFRRWQPTLGSAVRVLPLQLPGRWTRIREEPVAALPELVGIVSRLISSVGLSRYALYGHSFGAVVAYELARYRAATEQSLPTALVAAAHAPPRGMRKGKPIHLLPDDEFVAAMGPLERPSARAGRRHFDRIVKALKVDLRMSHEYEPSGDDPLPLPITAVWGRDDAYVTGEVMDGWRAETTGGFELLGVAGDHFFVHEPPAELLDAVRALS